MISLNRTLPPKFKNIEKINIIKAETHTLGNNIALYLINAGAQDIVKIDFIFNAGHWFQERPLVSSITCAMFNEGTSKLTSAQIAEKLDFHGAHLLVGADKDKGNVSLVTLNKFLPQTIEIAEDVIKNSIFPQKEFETYINKKKQSFTVENTKVKTLAKRKFEQIVFGERHPYGMQANIEDYDSLTISHLKNFHSGYYSSGNCKIIVSGKINDTVLKQIETFFGGADWQKNFKAGERSFKTETSSEKLNLVAKDDAVQSALRIGKSLFNRNHPDYIGMQVLNTVLGGYFGSRLMSNIREDKGYTYGIGSAMASYLNAGYFAVVSEVGADVCRAAVKEIYFEIKRLREELIPEDELTLVKSYILGDLLRSFDGPFALAESLKSVLDYGLDYTYYDRLVATVKNITADELIALANKYFQEESLIEVIAGKY